MFTANNKITWQLTANQNFAVDEKYNHAYSFQNWKRKCLL